VKIGSLPTLHAVTRPLDAVPEDLFSYADPHAPLVWVRGDRGCVGVGEVLRLRFSGPERFAEASATWSRITAEAVVDDPVRLPGSGLIAFGSFAFSESDPEGESVLIVPRLLISQHRGTAWITEISDSAISTEPRLPQSMPSTGWHGTSLPVSDPDPAYLDAVREATARIERAAQTESTSGSIEKIVIARQIHAEIRESDDLRVPLHELAERYTDCWTYAVGGIIGASPETLVRYTDGAISARVLAGTRGRKSDRAADARARDELLTSTKEQHEHSFAVQSVVTALAPHVRDLQTSEEPFALGLPNVWHLATDLGAVPGDGATSLDLTAALHPTAAVAGTPTARAVAAIAELEGAPRRRYAGPVGWIDQRGEGEWVIALRCAVIDDAAAGMRSVTAYAGGGIVAGSDPAHEFTETVSKFAPIAEAFAPR